MPILDFLVYAIPTVTLALLLLKPAANWLEDRVVWRDRGYGRARQAIIDQARASGATYNGVIAELFMREALMRYRREASDNVRADPVGWIAGMDRARKSVADMIAMENPELLPTFYGTIADLPYNHILDEETTALVNRTVAQGVDWLARPNDDMVNSMRIAPPSRMH